MHHGSGSQNMQRQLQRSKSVSGSEQQATVNHPQSPVTTFSCSASSSAPQSPNYQIIMSRSPSMNITLTTLPIQNPASPGFQHTTTQWRFEPYIQVTSPLPQPIQPQSPTQHSPVPLQSVTRPGAPATPLSVCGQSPGFVDANMMRIGGQPGLAQIATTTPNQVQLASPGTPGAVRERRPSQTGGTIHHLGPQSPVATGATLSTLSSPGHISTSNLPPQISSIIQGQLGRPVMFEKTAQAVVGPTSSASFSIPSSIPPSSPSLTSSTQGIPGNPLVPTSISVGTMKKPVPKKLEEIAPSTPEIAQLRKQCLEHHTKKMESLKEVFKEYLIELFFLQHLQGNMMDYLAFKKKPLSKLILKLELYQAKRSRIDVGRHGLIFQHPGVAPLGSSGVPLQQLMPTAQGGMPPTPQAAQIAGQKQNQQQYDPSKGPPVQNAASLHTPPPQLPGRLPQGVPPMASLPMTLSQQAQLVENTAQHSGQLQAQVKVQAGGPVLATVNPHTQLQAQLQQQMQPEQLQHGPGLLPEIKILVSQPLSIFQESQVHQRISELRKEGQWSASRLPKLMEASRPKSHWDYLLEEMQWMAADFAQERRWKEAAAKKLVRTCARYHQEQKKQEERSKKEREFHLRHIASTIAREVEFFWSNIEQVVEIKLQFEIYEKRLKALSLQKTPSKVPDEESTIEEQEGMEGETDHKAELVDLAKDAEIPLDALVKQYAGAYVDGFEWPQPCPDSDEDDVEDTEECPASSPPEAVLIDSLLSVDQYRGADKATSSDSDGKPARDIAEVAAATELILPKGSFRTTSSARSAAPFLLHGSLREYQQIGVDWLANLYKKHLNGILADETGLGKTIQTVAYMAHLAGQEGIWGPHLIVVRTCKLLSWEVEFKRWCPGLKILLYLGNRRQRRSKRMWWGEANNFHVCLTSYKLLMKDQIHFLKRRWRHLILDEVQLIKNMTEKHWETIFALTSEQRILLINTPLQNTLKELWTMIHFLLPGITRPYSDFPVKAGTDQNQDYCHKLVIRLHRVGTPFILRRSKRDVEKQLPKKYEHILKCRLSSRQKSLYEDILTQSGSQEALKTGHFVSVLQVLMQLQRVCNHPELVAPREMSSSYFCSSLQYNVPSLVLGAIQKDTSRIVNISIFDLINNENRLTRYQTEEVVPKLRVTRQLIEEIYNAPDPPPRPKPCPIKPMRLFQPVQYGTKPEGRLAAMTTAAGQRPPTSSPLTGTSASATSQSAQSRGKSPVTTATSIASAQGGDVVKIAQLGNITSSQNRISQPETPVTLQFQGNKFTLSPSQLRQLTTGQPLQLQGTLHIVSTPGQPIIRPHAIQPVTQALPASNASSTPATLHPALSTTQQGVTSVCTTSHCNVQESSEEKTQQQKERLSRLFEANERRCNRRVLYGSDLLQACTLMSEPDHSVLTAGGWSNNFYHIAIPRSVSKFKVTHIYLFLSCYRLLCVVPPAVAPPPHLYAANTPITYSVEQKSFRRQLHEASAPHIADIHDLACRHLFHYPDLQLMQMDSGKLEALAILLQKLRSENRRVLIFTQMVKMLDILEAFLDYRQLTYVRVDESFHPDERQENMKKFNRNRQVFCCILTNRCCSAVGTVFDADTIIFYDTDLNPSMDARTQEWCDRIGRSKDIHIYRLESGNSIEEKLLKNGTKDLIREVAAQGTDYTLAFLTQRTIQDLFEVEAGSGEKVEEFVVLHQEPSASEAISPRVARPYIQALHSINLDALPEEEEQQQEEEELADKETTNENQESETQAEEEPAQIEELNAVMEQLTPIERYALHYLEYLHVRDDETALKCSKRGWELQQLQKLKEEEQERQIMEGDEDLFTYTREDAYNMEYIFEAEDGHTEIMPLWTPPTPPQDDNDIYIDSVMMLMYDTTPMPESKLPPVYIRKEHKRLKMDPSAAARKKKKGHGETVIPPRSLFEKASMLKVRREGKDQKKNFSLKQQAPFAKPLPSLAKPAMEAGQDNPEWLISEDWALLQAVKQLLELPLNLTIVSPAHTPNWDLVSDVVNSCSRIYRSPKQCRNRYENVIIPREEGKSKNSRPLRTCQIYTQDDNATHMQLYNSRFELMKIIASKRSPPIKPLLGMNPFQKNPKHASVLAESGISYDKPLPPIQVASQRAERIAKEKKVTATDHTCIFLTICNSMQLAQQQQAGAPQAQTAPGQAQAPAAGQTQAQVPQAAAVAGAAAVSNAAVLVRITTPFVRGNVIVNTVAGVAPNPFQANKRLASPVIPGAMSVSHPAGAQVVHTQQRAVAGPAPSEVVTIATGPGVRAVTPVTAPAVVSPILSPAQSQPRQMGGCGPNNTGCVSFQTRLPTQNQAPQTAQVTLTKPPVVSVPAVVSTAGVTTLPVTVAGIGVAITQAQKTGIQAQPQTVTLTQAATSAPVQVPMIPAGTATAQVVQQKIIPQQVMTANVTSPQIQTPPPHSPAQQPAAPSAAESPGQQPTQPQQPTKGQARQAGIRAKTPAKPTGGGS
uniref:E1A binding protein p400 n=1 Tax=Mastacembelus armatus TaxID=205130 RepID=A0A7N8YD84_9TELE